MKGHDITPQTKSRYTPQEPTATGNPYNEYWVALSANHPVINSLWGSVFLN
jgi:hypothetical protein